LALPSLPGPQTPEDSASALPPPSLEPTASLLAIIGSIYGPDGGSRADSCGPGRVQASWQQSGGVADAGGEADAEAPAGAAPRAEGRRARARPGGQAAASAERSLVAAVELEVAAPEGRRGSDGAGDWAGLPADEGAACEASVAGADGPSFDLAEGGGGGAVADKAAAASEPGADLEQPDDAGARAVPAQLEGRLEARSQLRAELRSYVDGLPGRRSADGGPLVDAQPAELLAAVRRLLAERRGEFRALDGWEGLHE
jgi:hypothetical protein